MSKASDFYNGFGSVVDIGATGSKRRRKKFAKTSTVDAIRGDWKNVGRDMRKAVVGFRVDVDEDAKSIVKVINANPLLRRRIKHIVQEGENQVTVYIASSGMKSSRSLVGEIAILRKVLLKTLTRARESSR